MAAITKGYKLVLHVEPERIERLKEVARRQEVPMSVLVRRAIRELLEREGRSLEGVPSGK